MKTSAYYLERKGQKPLLVETEDQTLALTTLEKLTGVASVNIHPWVGKGKIVQNSTVSGTYFQKFWDVEKLPLSDFELVEVYKPCLTCGK